MTVLPLYERKAVQSPAPQEICLQGGFGRWCEGRVISNAGQSCRVPIRLINNSEWG